MSEPILVDLDAVKPEVEFSFKFQNKTHVMVPASLDDFIAATKIAQNSAEAGDPVKELETMRDMLGRGFPSLTPEDLGKLNMLQLQALMENVQKYNGVNAVTQEAGKEASNPPTGE